MKKSLLSWLNGPGYVDYRFIACLAVFCIFSATHVCAQLKADFSADTTIGCSPLFVNFKDISTGNPASWLWDFGNGNTSTLQNPQAVYTHSGTYTVKLTVSNGLTSDEVTKEAFITVADTPYVNFLVSPATGCYPLNVSFKDGSSTNFGSIQNWLWDFGDGTLSHDPNPSHIYDNAGKFNVALSVTNTAGCIGSVTQKAAVVTNKGIKATFSADRTFSCSSPLTVHFTTPESDQNTVTYLWDFGDGAQGSGSSPSHTYTQNGIYSVRLTAYVVAGCTDTTIREDYIHIGTFKPDFQLPTGCANVALPFKNTSSPEPDSAVWYFSDGAVARGLNVTHIFQSSGVYEVKMISIYGTCRDSVTKSITVSASPKAAFSTDNRIFCSKPASVSFNDESQGPASWFWQFGDGKTSTLQRPVHAYQSTGNFDVKLLVTNKDGCSDSVLKTGYIHIDDPVVQFNASSVAGCIPFNVSFHNQVQSLDAVTSYHWDFGDGSSSTTANPSHTYTAEGTYTVVLKIITAAGCTDSLVRQQFIHAGTKPKVEFDASLQTACLQTPVQFTNRSQPEGTVWKWIFPQDGDSTTTDENPLWYFHHLGKQSVMLIVNNNGCADTLTKTNLITIEPPQANIGFTRNCEDPYTVKFTDKSIGAHDWHWDFGDGATSDDANPAPHRYQQPGLYRIILTITNGNCSSADTLGLRIIDEHPVLKAPDVPICHGDTVVLSAANITNEQFIRSYTWLTGDGRTLSSSTSSEKVVYPQSGHFGVRLITTDVNGCHDTTAVDSIRVRGPHAAFTVSSPANCPGNNISFSDESQADAEAAISRWVWNYGDGTTDTLTQPPFHHNYTEGGQYKVTLTVTDENGCSDDSTKINAVHIYPAKADFSVSDTLICPGTPIQWKNTSQGNNLIYHWDFGDNTSSQEQIPDKIYREEGTYTVSLGIQTSDGCRDSIVKENYIRSAAPHADMEYTDNQADCPPFVVTVVNRSRNYQKIFWDFGDGTTSTLDTARHVYNIPGNYRLRLLVYGYNDCMDSLIRTVSVAGPYGEASFDASGGCQPYTARFSARSVNALSYRWDFGDGIISPSSSENTITHVYDHAGIYSPQLILIDERQCKVAIPLKETITVDDIQTKPVFSWPEPCDSNHIRLQNEGTIYSADSLGKPASYRWDFGDPSVTDDTSQAVQPDYRYAASGTYPVVLHITTAYGCSQQDTVAIPIPESTIMNITTSGDTAICQGTSVTLQASGGERYVWTPAPSLNDPEQPAPVATPDSSTTYQVIGYSKGDCQTDTAQVHVTVHNKPEVNAGEDQTVPTGSVIQLQATGSPDVVQWNWTPQDYLSCTHCADPVSTPRSPVTYTVEGTNGFGCSTEDDMKITLVCAEGAVYIPNTFTPNGDGINDVFYPRGKGVQQVLYLHIYNRWGQLVFSRTHFQLNDKSAGWNGTFRGEKLLPDVFMYSASMVCDDNKVFEVKGSITLLR